MFQSQSSLVVNIWVQFFSGLLLEFCLLLWPPLLFLLSLIIWVAGCCLSGLLINGVEGELDIAVVDVLQLLVIHLFYVLQAYLESYQIVLGKSHCSQALELALQYFVQSYVCIPCMTARVKNHSWVEHLALLRRDLNRSGDALRISLIIFLSSVLKLDLKQEVNTKINY